MTTKLGSAVVLGLLLAGPLAGRNAVANPELDRQYALETVGFLKSWDNVDGLFADYVSTAFREYFLKQSRFTLQDLSKASAVLASSTLPYNQVIEDPELLGQLARSTRSQTVVRTKILKEGASYKFTLEWLQAPRMDKIAEDAFTLSNISEIKDQIAASMDRIVAKVPFIATVTGRDNSSVTIDIGSGAKVSPGDTLVIGTLEDVKRHPLLKSIVDWRVVETGRAEVESVDEGISFGRVTEELEGRQVERFQKVIRIIPKPDAPPPVEKIVTGEDERNSILGKSPTFGWGSAGLWTGSYSRQYSAGGGSSGKSGSGLFVGMKAEGQLWLTREWFGEIGFGYGFAGYSQSDIATGAESTGAGGSANVLGFHLDGGYTYYATPDFHGPKGSVRFGYRSFSYSLPTSTAEATGPSTFKGLYLGIGGDLPIRGRYGALVSLDYGLLTKASSPGLAGGSVISSTDVNFYLGGYYRHTDRLTVRVGLDVTGHGADFSSGTTLTQRVISLGPSLLFYF